MLRRKLDRHAPRFEHENLFFYALLGLVSFSRKLRGQLNGCWPQATSDVVPAASASHPTGTSATEFDYLLLGLYSYERKASLHIADLLQDGQRELAATLAREEPRATTSFPQARRGLLR